MRRNARFGKRWAADRCGLVTPDKAFERIRFVFRVTSLCYQDAARKVQVQLPPDQPAAAPTTRTRVGTQVGSLAFLLPRDASRVEESVGTDCKRAGRKTHSRGEFT